MSETLHGKLMQDNLLYIGTILDFTLPGVCGNSYAGWLVAVLGWPIPNFAHLLCGYGTGAAKFPRAVVFSRRNAELLQNS